MAPRVAAINAATSLPPPIFQTSEDQFFSLTMHTPISPSWCLAGKYTCCMQKKKKGGETQFTEASQNLLKFTEYNSHTPFI